jgi:predicted DNA-binding transcriptional regulator AlpA
MEAHANNFGSLDRLMPLVEVVKVIGRSVREVWREINRGKLPKPVHGRPARLFESDVQKYLKQLRDERDGKSNNEKDKL